MSDVSIKQNQKKKKQIETTMQQAEVEIIGGVACPIDPQERLECESCQ